MITVTHIKPQGYIHSDCFDHVADALRGAAARIDNPPEVEIFIAAHLAYHSGVEIPDGATIWNFEQVATGNPWLDENYRALAERCHVLDYSEANVRAWKELHNIDAQLLPLCYDPKMSGVVERCKGKLDVPRFYGSSNPRREAILKRFDHIRPSGPAYGSELDKMLSRSPCIVNLHFYESAVFEVVRCSYLWANAVPVLSEPSADQADYGHIPDLFAESVDDLVERVTERDYPDGMAQRAAYMAGPWLADKLEELL